MNYGALGVITGHELTHGFDDEGVQWDGVGALNQWMQNDSYQAFKVQFYSFVELNVEFQLQSGNYFRVHI